MRYVDFLTLRSIFKGIAIGIKIVNINFKCKYYVWIFNLKLDLNTPLVLIFQTPPEVSIKGIRVRYAEIMTLLSIFKGTMDIH